MTPIPDTPETQGKECKASESGKHEWAPDTKVWCVWCSALKGEPVCPVCDGPVDPADSKCMTCDIKLKPREPQKDETCKWSSWNPALAREERCALEKGHNDSHLLESERVPGVNAPHFVTGMSVSQSDDEIAIDLLIQAARPAAYQYADLDVATEVCTSVRRALAMLNQPKLEPREPHAALIAERFAPYVVHIKPCPLSGFTLKEAAAYRLRGNEVDDCRCGLDGLLALKGA